MNSTVALLLLLLHRNTFLFFSYQSYTSSMASGPNAKVAYVTSDQNSLGSYYTRHRPQKTAAKQKDAFKVFHNIPQSSLLLTDYDPFYSPLLSRLDAVFKQLRLDLNYYLSRAWTLFHSNFLIMPLYYLFIKCLYQGIKKSNFWVKENRLNDVSIRKERCEVVNTTKSLK